MSISISDSNISLIPLEEVQPESKKAKLDENVNPVQPNGTLKQKKRRKGLFNLGNQIDTENGKIKSNSWIGKAKSKEDSVPTLFINSNGTTTQTSPKSKKAATDSTATNDVNESQSLLSWLKSLFTKRKKEVDIRSDKTKRLYFGFLLPAFVFHPESLKECKTPKFDEDFRLHLAAAHINDALHSRGKYGKARAVLKSKNIQTCYSIISSQYWEYLMYLFIALHCFMAFWEQSPSPIPIGESWNGDWEVSVAVLVIDAICTVSYIIDIALWIAFLSWRHLWKAKENFWIRVECVFTLMFIVDYTMLVLQRVLEKRLVAPFRCLRAAMLLCKSKNVSHIFKVLLSIMSRLGKVFAIIFIFIFTFASIGLHLYMDTYHEINETCSNATRVWNCTNVYSGSFDNVAIAGLHMFVLMSTENYPDVIIQAYDTNHGNFFYFMIYLYAGVFFLTAILLAIIVESYWEYSKKHVKMERLRQREELIKAWNLLDLNGTGCLSVDDDKLVKLFRILRPKNSDDENMELIAYMSENNEDYIIDSFDWTTRLVETLSIEFEPETPEKSAFKLNVNPTNWMKMRKLSKRIIHAHGIGMAILFLILLHSILFSLMWYGITENTQVAFQICRSVLIFVFIIEISLRAMADGKKLLNILDVLDMVMVLIAIGGNVAWYIIWYTSAIRIYLGACIVVSSLAVLARLLFNSEQARSAVHILRNIYPVMFDLILLVVIIIYFYAILGLEIFQDNTLEKSEEEGFEGSYMDYDCGVGFQTFGCALMIVFQIVTTNDWHQIMLGAMIDAGWASSFYFVSCYLIIDMIVMNLFVAISIEAYKKLARDDREVAPNLNAQSPAEENDGENQEGNAPMENRPSNSKADRSLGEAAKNAFTGIFASTRGRRPSNSPGYGAPAPGMMQLGRRGPRGSVAALSIHTVTSDDDSGDDTVISHRNVPGSPRMRNRSFRFSADTMPRKRSSSSTTPDITPVPLRKTSSLKESKSGKTPARDRRQRQIKARSERVRQERKAKQQQMQQQQTPPSKRLEVPSPKLSMSDVVNLKKMVKILMPYRAKSSKEMSLEEGQMLSISDEKGNMYQGPDGWFPKNHAMEVSMEVSDGGPFSDSPILRRRREGKVSFKVEDETGSNDTSSSSAAKLSPTPGVHHRSSVNRMRIRKDGTAWRKEIHGDMTVMNRTEMEALSRHLKGGGKVFERRQARNIMAGDNSRLSNFNTRSRVKEDAIQETIEEREEEMSPDVPEVRVSEAPIPTEASSESNDDSVTRNSNTGTLSVPGSAGSKGSKVAKRKGEMPDWAKNFVASKGVELQEDVKFDDAELKSAGSSDDEDRLAVLVHRSDTSTGSSFENLSPDSTSTQPSASILKDSNKAALSKDLSTKPKENRVSFKISPEDNKDKDSSAS